MLQELTIKNYALIESLRLRFNSGLHIFTGETGAGKTIIIEALQLILGARTSPDIIRRGAERAVITGVFDIGDNKDLAVLLEEKDLVDSGNPSLILRREVDASGKSRCYCNDTPVTLTALGRIGELLVDIHGQYGHQVLLKPLSQLDFLDGYAGLESERDRVSGLYSSWKSLAAELNSLQLSRDEREHKIDLYSFQVREIDSAQLKSEETEKLEEILPRLKNADKLTSLSRDAYDMLYENDNSVLTGLGRVQKLLDDIDSVSKSSRPWTQQLEDISSRLKDVADDISEYRSSLEIDPDEYERMVERKDIILKLKRKYGNTVAEILEYRDRTAAELDKLEHNQDNIRELEKNISSVLKKLETACSGLTSSRKKVSGKLEKQVQKELRDLGMPKARFKINISPALDREGGAKITSSGKDTADFMFSPNVGEELMPLREIASGGEMSRTMLALKTVMGKADRIPTMVFDEIDSGVSGPMGQVIGQKLSHISKTHQVFCITHLAQLASFAGTHFHIDKQVKGSRTYSSVQELNDKNRVDEISRMLSGGRITETTRRHAQELLEQAGTVK